jgi:hypothetical protein
MNWEDLTLFQFQQIVKDIEEKDIIQRNMKLIMTINNWTSNHVRSLSIQDYNTQVSRLKFINTEVKGKSTKYIDINGRKYKCIYNVYNLNSARYIETKVFSAKDMVDNMHKIAASMVVPMKKTFFGWKEDKYDASKHELYSQDMLEAKFVHVYFNVVFFYHVLKNLTEGLLDYLNKELKNPQQALEKKELQDFWRSMDGSIVPSL